MLILYTKSDNPKSPKFKNYLDRRGLIYKEIDISNDLDSILKFERMFPKTGLPVVQFLTGELMSGPIPSMVNKINKILKC